MLFDMKIGQRQFAYIITYKPPSVDNNTFKRELCNLLDEANSLSDNVIFTGDLNSDTYVRTSSTHLIITKKVSVYWICVTFMTLTALLMFLKGSAKTGNPVSTLFSLTSPRLPKTRVSFIPV